MSDVWPENELEWINSCPICHCGDRSLLHEGLSDRLFHCAPGLWDLYRCQGCQSAYINPRPTVESIGRAYSVYATHDQYNLPTSSTRGWRGWAKRLCEGYRLHCYGVQENAASAAGRWLIPLVPPLRGSIDSSMRHLSRPISGKERLLDVGCGNAHFLSKARSMGWKVKGVDFDPKAVAVGRFQELDIVCGGVEELAHEASRYDVITVSHVIEHVHDPEGLLRHIYRLLKPGGSLWIETPNIFALGHRFYGACWRGLEPPRHLVIFSPNALSSLLVQVGFIRIVKRFNGLVTFSVFAASDALTKGENPLTATRGGKPPLRDAFAELYEMVFSSSREFLTLQAQKPL